MIIQKLNLYPKDLMQHLVTKIRIKQLEINDEQDPIRKQRLRMELENLTKSTEC